MADKVERDRTKRYENSPKGAKKHGAAEEGAAAAEHKAAATAAADKTPQPDNPDKTGKVGADPGPDGAHNATFGEMATRHKREHGDMTKRHGEEAAQMHERHTTEAKAMHTRHASEMEAHVTKATETAGAAAKAEASAGSPKELGSEKSEGKAGTNA
jgi:hypothetical protein